jgi:molybdopterin converting factor small subunit
LGLSEWFVSPKIPHLSVILGSYRWEGMEIKVKVYAPSFIHNEIPDGDGYVTLPEGATLNDLYKKLKLPLPLRLNFLFSVNYEQAHGDTQLKDGDVVSFLFPVSGG